MRLRRAGYHKVRSDQSMNDAILYDEVTFRPFLQLCFCCWLCRRTQSKLMPISHRFFYSTTDLSALSGIQSLTMSLFWCISLSRPLFPEPYCRYKIHTPSYCSTSWFVAPVSPTTIVSSFPGEHFSLTSPHPILAGLPSVDSTWRSSAVLGERVMFSTVVLWFSFHSFYQASPTGVLCYPGFVVSVIVSRRPSPCFGRRRKEAWL